MVEKTHFVSRVNAVYMCGQTGRRRSVNAAFIFLMVVKNSVAWLFFHMMISFLGLQIPDAFLDRKKTWFESKPWEKEGRFWQKRLKIRVWKDFLPDSSSFLKGSYDQTRLHSSDSEKIQTFIRETKRAELVHWVSMCPALLFFLWNPPWAGWIMVLYAICANIPFILVQRFNRPRLERLYEKQRINDEKQTNYSYGIND